MVQNPKLYFSMANMRNKTAKLQVDNAVAVQAAASANVNNAEALDKKAKKAKGKKGNSDQHGKSDQNDQKPNPESNHKESNNNAPADNSTNQTAAQETDARFKQQYRVLAQMNADALDLIRVLSDEKSELDAEMIKLRTRA